MTHTIEQLMDDSDDDAITLIFFRKHELEYETSHTPHPVTHIYWSALSDATGLFDVR